MKSSTTLDYSCRISKHGQSQLELAIVYPIVADRKHVRYLLDFFIFSPGQLGLTEEQYGVKRFLHHLQSYTRHTPPSIPLAKLIDPECKISPLTRIRSALSEVSLSRDLDGDRLLYELRTLVNIYHAELREVRNLIRRQILRKEGQLDADGRLATLMQDIGAFLEAFRSLHSEFVDPRIPTSLREGLRWADEAISIKTEKEECRLYHLTSERLELVTALPLLRKRLGQEAAYRKNMGYSAQASPNSLTANELFLYREAMLKKWAQGSMYMAARPSRITKQIVHVFAGVAAAIAMAFAVIATFVASQLFPSNTVPWAILIVIAYIFKDRIKEVLRGVLISWLPHIVADHTDRLIDPALKTRVGTTRLRIRFCKPKDVPGAVRQLRNMQGNPFRIILPQEDVIQFHKEMHLASAVLTKGHPRLESITEILRLKLDSWMAEMDDPFSTIPCMVDEEPTTVPAKRVYHLNLIVQMIRADRIGPPALFRHRITLNREGIVRIVPMDRTLT